MAWVEWVARRAERVPGGASVGPSGGRWYLAITLCKTWANESGETGIGSRVASGYGSSMGPMTAVLRATTGVPAARDSRRVRPKPSTSDGKQWQVKHLYQRSGVVVGPRK